MAHLLASWGTGDPVPHTSWIGVSSAGGRPRMRSTNRGSISVGAASAANRGSISVIEDGSSGLKPLLPKTHFRRSSFSRDPCVIEDGGVRGESPSYQKPIFVGAALAATSVSSKTEVRSRDLVIEDGSELSERLQPRPLCHRRRRFGVIGAASAATSVSSRTEIRGESPSYQKPIFVGAALAATFVSSKMEVRSYRSGFSRDLCVIEDGDSGLKPLLPKTHFRRSGFSRDPCAIEDRGVRGESPSYQNRFS
jgi:hypothetical protein